MPKDTKEDLAGTIQRSSPKARRTYAETLESAHEEYDSEERAQRTAYASLKDSFEKVGDHWEPMDHKGLSDERARSPRGRRCESAGGLDVPGHTSHELYDRARKLGVSRRSRMKKTQLARAIARWQD